LLGTKGYVVVVVVVVDTTTVEAKWLRELLMDGS
jgi:hypothetical protein